MTGSRAADLELALAAARVAGEAVMSVFRSDPDVRHKSPDQPVTDADLEADRILADRLLGERPDYGWLSEETVDRPERLERERVWIVDPIDGTQSYISGYREFAVSVGLAEAGTPTVGVVYNPARDEVFWATAGGGAFRDRHWSGGAAAGRPLAITEPPAGLKPALLASRREISDHEFASFEADWHVRPVGSTAYKLAGVASGTGHAFLSRGPKNEWDVVAGALIVEEAGGRVSDLRGAPVRYNGSDPYVHGVLAAPPGLHARLLEHARGLRSPRLRDGT